VENTKNFRTAQKCVDVVMSIMEGDPAVMDLTSHLTQEQKQGLRQVFGTGIQGVLDAEDKK
jgi:hypothetical protein